MIHVDFLTVLIAAVVYMIISIFWYSPYLFGNLWMKLKKLEKADIRKKPIALALNFVFALLLSYFLSLIEIFLGATSFWDGVIAGFLLYIGFVLPTQIIGVVWVKNTFKVFLIDNVCWMLSMMVMGGILVG